MRDEQASSAASASLSETSVHSVNVSEITVNNGTGAVSSEQTNMVTGGKASDTPLLDDQSLLACIVRTIPAGGRIRINSTVSSVKNSFSSYHILKPFRSNDNYHCVNYSYQIDLARCFHLCIGMITRENMES